MKKQTYDNYFKEYEQKRCRRVSLNLSTSKDADIIEYLNKRDNIQGTIKELVREGIKKHN